MKVLSRWLVSLATVLLTLILLAPVVYAVPPMPHSFYGMLKINGLDAPPGTIVTAKFGAEVICGTYTTTEVGKYGDSGMAIYLAVTHDNIHEGDAISFYVNGVEAVQTALFVPGGVPTELSLTALTATPSVVEVNSGNTINLTTGEVVTGNATVGISVGVKDLLDLGAPVNGLAAFQFDFNWDKDVIHVDSATRSQEISEWYIETGIPDNANGTLVVAGFTTIYSTDDIILFYLGIHAVGSGGDSTSINVTITSLFEKNNITIPATPINAPVTIVGVVAETSLAEGLSSYVAGVLVVDVNIDRIKDPSDNSTANITGGI
ncbi:hypothetical protein ACFLUJ_09375, partial [Chloroflexota bacterium]